MSLSAKIADETKAALLGGDRFVGETLRNLKAAILNEEVASGKRESGLSDEEIEKIVAKEVKKRAESAKLYRDNNRPELAEPEEKEAEILARFLPEQMSEDDLRKVIEVAITDMGVTSPQAMGQVIGVVKKQVGNTADGSMIARLTNEALNK